MNEENRERMDHLERREAVVEDQVAAQRVEDHVEDRSEEPRESRPSAIERELLPLLEKGEAEEFRSRWQDIQTEFVDDPRHSVENADELVAQVINSITENFANERNTLEDQWNRGEEASTEDLRVAMMRYRSFFNRLLTLEFNGTSE